ncbi:MAG: hypothetical protein ABFQ95_04005 [Pseudomonadota bacterium]
MTAETDKSASYPELMILIIAFAFSLLQFNGIAKILSPILEVRYPGLILLMIVNITTRLVR